MIFAFANCVAASHLLRMAWKGRSEAAISIGVTIIALLLIASAASILSTTTQ